jgi:hypothetical protein
MLSRSLLLAGFCCAAVSGCSRSNNLMLGRIEAKVGGHTVVVTDCYRTSVPEPQVSGPPGREGTYRFVPCRDADITIKAGRLTVNGRSYGAIADGDTIVVDHGKVLVNDREAQVVASSH